MATSTNAAVAISLEEQNANAGDDGLAQVTPASVRQMTAQSYWMRHLTE
jgi:hypothetical protein